MTHSVKVEATYTRNQDIPLIGRRKMMRVNGKVESLVLVELEVRRRWCDDIDGNRVIEFSTTQIWGPYGERNG